MARNRNGFFKNQMADTPQPEDDPNSPPARHDDPKNPHPDKTNPPPLPPDQEPSPPVREPGIPMPAGDPPSKEPIRIAHGKTQVWQNGGL